MDHALFGQRLTGAAIACAVWSSLVVGVQVVGTNAALAAVPTGPFSVDVTDREAVRQFYNVTHQGAVGVSHGWTGGSTATCTPGTTSTDFLSATLSRTNYFRAMAGIPGVTYDGTGAGTSSSTLNARAQAAALMQAANGRLEHVWGPVDACFSQLPLGVAASGTSNLASGGPVGDITSRIDALVYDGGELGHRRNMFAPRINLMGAGAATSNGTAYFAHEVLTTPLPTRPPVRDNFVAWPNKGFIPYQVVPSRWSFALPGADFSQATVTMTRGGTALAAQVLCFDPSPGCTQYGEPAIIWRPAGAVDGAPWPKPAADEALEVTVAGVRIGGITQAPFVYTTTVIDPAQWDKQWTSPTGPASPPVGQNSTYNFTPIPGSTGYQWRTMRLNQSTFLDGAEGDLGNWTAAVGGYPPIQSVIKETGTSAFHLSVRSFAQAETLTLNRTLLANADSQLTFKSRVVNFSNLVGRVQVSADGGATWDSPPAFEQGGGNEAGFTNRSVSLGSYAGRLVQVRFWLSYDFSGQGVCLCDSSSWYFDDVALSNVQEVAPPVLSSVGASPSFVFSPSTQAGFLIDVRPQFAGPSFGAFSKTLAVTSASPRPVQNDFNADSRSDVLWRNSLTGQNVVWFVNGATRVSTAVLPSVSDVNWSIQGIDDHNGDGKPDLLWRHATTGEAAVWLMNGTTRTSMGILGAAPAEWKIVGSGDFNADSRSDVLWRNSLTGQNVVWFVNGATRVSTAVLPSVSDVNWSIQGIDDHNGDGKPDLLWRHATTGEAAVWLMNGTTRTSMGILGAAPAEWKIVGSGDFNADSRSDVLWRNSLTGQNVVWFVNGATRVSTAVLPSVSDVNWSIQGIDDHNGDGKPDLLWRHATTGEAAVWLMNGTTRTSMGILGAAPAEWKIVPAAL